MPRSPLQELAVVPLAALVLHEAVEPRRAAAVRDGIRRSGVLTDPIVAAPARYGRWLVLDGVHRTTALADLGVPVALIQQVPLRGLAARDAVMDRADAPERDRERSPGARLEAWAHDIPGLDPSHLVTPSSPDTAPGPGRPADLATVATVLSAGRSWEVRSTADLPARLATMRSLAGRYAQLPYLRRHPGDPGPAAGSVRVAWAAARPDDLVTLAATGDTFPAGVSRLVVHGRVLGVRVPLTELGRAAPGGVVDEAVVDQLLRGLASLPVRLYREPVWVVEATAPPVPGGPR